MCSKRPNSVSGVFNIHGEDTVAWAENWKNKPGLRADCLSVLHHLLHPATLASLIRAAQEWECILQSPDSSTAPAQAATCLCSHLFTAISRTDHSFRSIQHRLCSSLIWRSQWKTLIGFPGSSITRTDQLSPQPYHCFVAQGISLGFVQTANYTKKKPLAHRTETGKK